MVREGKGGKDRYTMPPRSLAEPLQREIERARVIHAEDLAAGFGATRLPHAWAHKHPRAAREFGWQFVFPSAQRGADPLDGTICRHQFDDAIRARAMKSVRQRTGIDKPLSSHTLRHSFATHLIETGYDIRTVQERLGHKDVSTTASLAHLCARGIRTSMYSRFAPTSSIAAPAACAARWIGRDSREDITKLTVRSGSNAVAPYPR